MKTILGLDLGVSSIGWALVKEAENEKEISSIIRLGVRVNPLTVDELLNFEKGKSITTNAERTLKRSMRRNLQRYKLRRDSLIKILKQHGIISDESILSESGNYSTFQTYCARSRAATEQVTLQEFARILLMINKKRGYKSSRKVNNQEEGQLIDGMEVAKCLYEEGLTPGELTYKLLKEGKNYIPEFYRSDLQGEFNRIWECQQSFYPDILTNEFKREIEGKTKKITAGTFKKVYEIYTAENKEKDKRLQAFRWRVNALTKQLSIEEVAFVFSEINGAISNSSGYLGAISDRSKELYFKNQTVGQFLMDQLTENPHEPLKNQVFYRQDYLNEFEKIWETQATYYDVLTPELKEKIRDVVIFYQRKLKSQKGLINFCEFESRQVEIIENGKKKIKTNGLKVCPKSSPLFQEFKIWQQLNNITVAKKEDVRSKRFLVQEEKELLFEELSIKKQLTASQVLKFLFKNSKELETNYQVIEGNKTQAILFGVWQNIIELSGHGKYDFQKMNSKDVLEIVKSVFTILGYNTDILRFDSALEGVNFEKQSLFQLWHLLYSFEGDQSNTGNAKLIQKLARLYGFEKEYAVLLANVVFEDDYGSLSTKAIRTILPYMKEGSEYSVACTYAGYRHSKHSLTKEEIEHKVYKEKLDILPKNSLRNPVVEKILNQMVNVVNQIIDTYGKPDEVRIELARELKKNAKQREQMTVDMGKAASNNQRIRELLREQFGLKHVSRNDVIRYKLYEELRNNGYRTLYSNTYISPDKLFSKEFDIEHIIPQSRLFDDSFSNKTLEESSVNREKGNETAYDYVVRKYKEEEVDTYLKRVEDLYKRGILSRTKYGKLLLKGDEISEGFINRDLNDTQYIARKAKEMLEGLTKKVVSTTGTVTDRLREDWQLIDVMQELNWKKYDSLELTEVFENREGHKVKRIKDWTKRNDHRHHAMDALTVAFTKQSYIQYLNNLNARSDKTSVIYGIEKKELKRDGNGNLRFISPIQPVEYFRTEAKRQLENILVSIKSKNKVVTVNINRTKASDKIKEKKQLTPRGQLHQETIYGSIQRYKTKEEKVGAAFDEAQIAKVTDKRYQEALQRRLAIFDNDPKKAFAGKNSLVKNPLYIDEQQTECVPEKVTLVTMETVYTVRKEITPDIRLDKVIDVGIRKKLEARLNEYDGDSKKAFSNLTEAPIWLNEEKGISIKRVTIRGINNAEALHRKKDKKGNVITDEDGKEIPADFVNTGNNHHVAIYRDEKGNLQESVISFYEATATARVDQKLPIVNKSYKKEEGWQFLFSMKQNEYFVFPNPETGFDPKEIDLMNPDNYAEISPNLYRVQKFTTKDYFFRHHLETAINDDKRLKNITWLRCGLSGIENIVKVRINHIGEIVSIGE